MASALYVALLHEGSIELATEFAKWWIQRTGYQPRSEAGASYPAGVSPSTEFDADELGIDQEPD